MTGSVGITGSLAVTGASTFINTINLNKATQPTAGVYIGSSSSTSSSSIFVKTASVNSSLSSGFGVNGIYSGGLSTIKLHAIGTQTAGGYASSMIFVLDNNGVEREHAIFSSDGSTTLYGNVGIGTASNINQRLTILDNNDAEGLGVYRNFSAASDAGTYIRLGALNGSSVPTTGAAILGALEGSKTAGYLTFLTVSASTLSERMRITSGGNVGIGVTPTSGWDSDSKALQIGIKSSFADISASGDTHINNNCYWDGSQWKYLTSSNAGNIYISDSNIGFRRAASGTAGNNISWNTSMLITSAGNVGIGTGSPAYKLTVNNTADDTSYFAITTNGNDRLVISTDSSANARIRSGNNVDLRLGVNEDAIVIKNGGNVGIGTTTPAVQLHVSGGIRFSSSGADANRWSVYWNGGTGDLIVVNNISDIRAKKDFDYDIKGLETIQKLKPLKFTWKDGTSHSTSVSGRVRQYGFIAQETMEADDYLAWHNENQDTWGIEQYESFSAVMVKAIQEQQAQIQELSAKITQLENK
jgi:hypothetical protein